MDRAYLFYGVSKMQMRCHIQRKNFNVEFTIVVVVVILLL